ncbi:substrate-binding domain-containing protein [Capnocytophaga sp. oral taxon 878]|uniref:hybrid sensor histidine kinase/response regulator transcription factor n=1 Tax=Capnocytophaga sp. oral taxon 878 TaxID=1316596 RepID=UPI000D03EE96|nr:AraC family transcriptional regulator [Capnocytophaga sp. oral taxon 878]
MTFRRYHILFLYFALFACLACQRERNPRYVIGVSQCSEDLWRQTMNEELKREVALYQADAEVLIRSVKDDTPKQIADIEWFIEQKVDVLVVSPNESEACTPVIEKAYQQGIPVILVDRKIATESYTAYVGANNYQIGKEAGLYAIGVLKGKGNIAEVRGTKGSTSDAERHKGFVDALKNAPEVQIVAETWGNFLQADAKTQMQQLFQEQPHIDLVFAMNDPMAAGTHEAAMQFNGKIPFIIGVDALQQVGIQNIENNVQDASFIYPTGGEKVIELAMKILHKQPFERENILNTTVVDKSNVRILQLQTEQIAEKQAKIENINNQLSESLIQHTNQRMLLYLSITAIVLITVFLLMAIRAYRAKSKTNSELKRQKEQLEIVSKQLEEATQAKLLFFTNISHEFKTPLSLILGPVQTLLAHNSLPKEEQDLLFLIKKNSNRLLHLISEVIEFRSYENNKMQMYFTKGNLKSFLNELNSFFTDRIKQKKLNFQFVAEDTSFEMAFDKEKVEKIYFNLLSNALKFTPQEGSINVSLTKEDLPLPLSKGEVAVLRVFNNGSYIPKDKQNEVFEHFYKINPDSEGSGIGLALVQALVASHNGTISVESTEGEGTTFVIRLPFSQEQVSAKAVYDSNYIETHLDLLPSLPASAEKLKLPTASPSAPEKPTVLIVEDNEDMRQFIRYILSDSYNLIEAENGEEGFEVAKKHLPDVVISDVMMPKTDGFDLCQLIKTNVATNHIPVILLTAYALDEQKQVGFESGADAYISKPFNVKLLKTRVRKLIENRKKIRESFSNFLLNETKQETLGKVEQQFITDFTHYVENSIANPEMNIDEIADALGLSRSNLYRKIKSLTDYSPNELIRTIRVKYAKQLLNSKAKSISEVAYEVGFSSPSYFAKCFKDFYNESPTEYLERIR